MSGGHAGMDNGHAQTAQKLPICTPLPGNRSGGHAGMDSHVRAALRRLADTPRFPLLCGPTPLQRMERLEQALGCGPLYVKRDDLTPLGMGGNKTRKLEFLVADALANGADTLVTVGGVQTNHGRLTAAAAAKAGLACTLVLEGTRPALPSGNLLLDCLLNAALVFTDGAPVQAVIDRTLRDLAAAGKTPYFIPEGGSNAVGSAGYLALIPELMQQLAALPEPPQHLVCAMGSLGTFTGLWAGARAFGAPFSVTGIAVNPNTSYTPERAAVLAWDLSDAYHLALSPDPAEMEIVYADGTHDYAGTGYNVPDEKTRAAVLLLARTEGIFLDPCYTAKAFRGFCALVQKRPGGAVFLHTGGTPALWTEEHFSAFAAQLWQV